MGTTNNAYSDLIHLFIDGEATETERNVLFGALKDSPELQEEFSSAMQLKQAFAADIMKLQPPSYLQSQIAERAGLIVAASSSIATAPIVVNSVSNSITSAISSVAPMAATGISKGLLTLIIGTSVGVLSTVGVMQLTKESPKQADRSSSVVNSRSLDANRPMTVAESQKNIPQTIDHRPSAIDKLPSLRSAAPLLVLHYSKAAFKENSAVNKAAESVTNSESVNNNIAANNIIPAQPETVNTFNNNSSEIPPAAENVAATPAMPAFASIDPLIPAIKNIGWTNASHNPIHNGNDEFFREPDWMARLSLSIKGMPTSQFYQGNGNIASAPAWNNIGFAVKYDADIFSAFALEFGQETFPVYLSNGNGGFAAHQSIVWVGGSYTISNPLWKILGIYPEARLLVGGAINAGLITKISAGLVFQPTKLLSFTVDPEYTSLLVSQNGTPVGGSKLGLTYSFIFHF